MDIQLKFNFPGSTSLITWQRKTIVIGAITAYSESIHKANIGDEKLKMFKDNWKHFL